MQMNQTQNRRQQLINLNKLSISINNHNNYNYLTQTSYHSQSIQQTNRQRHLRNESQLQQQNKQYLIVVKFDFIQSQPLTTLIKQFNIFTLHCGIDLTISANFKLSKLFDLQTLNYFTQIQTLLNYQHKLFIKAYIIVNTQQYQFNQLKHQIQIHFITQQQLLINNQTTRTLIINNNRIKYPFIIENFIAYKQQLIAYKQQHNTQNNQLRFEQFMQKPIIKNLSINNDYSYPLIDNLQLTPQSNQINKLKQSINQLQQYRSPVLSKQSDKQLYICHDMKGGYIEDINTFNPIRDTNNSIRDNNSIRCHSYRFDYLSQTKIFNYFSHYPITIPPKHWRLLCKSYNTLCLGTFIVQPNQYMIDEDDFMTQQFALKLIYIAKKAKFDGYLINIQIPIKKVTILINWLTFLTKQINKLIPNSQIIYYDSIISNGQIKYQNQLNQYNLPFYQSTNAIFTNYWWNQSSLINSLKYKHKQKSIYIGNDCWGRNTYGGGKYDIYNAINKIQSISKGQLSIALFAPAYTYQDNAESSLQIFTQNQLKMYHGHNVINKNITKWKITQNGGQGWKQQAQWTVTSYQLCKRQALIDINQYQSKPQTLTIIFTCFIVGTAPNYSDHYKITLQLYDYKNNMVYHELTYPNTVATQKQQRVEIRMQIDCELITDGICLRVLQQGKDAEFWAGHFGTRFKGQTISLTTQTNLKNWIHTIPIQPVNLNGKSYTTFFNKGQGQSFYHLGTKIQKNYDCLSDQDFPPVFSLNNPSCLQVQYKDGFIGGSSLRFRNTNNIIVNKFVIDINKQKQRTFKIFVTVKGTQVVSLIYGKDKKQIKPDNGIKNQSNQWKRYSFQMVLSQEDSSQIEIQLNFSTSSGLIGYFGIFDRIHCQQMKNQQITFNLSMKLSNKPKYIFPYCVDIALRSNTFSNQTYIPERPLMNTPQRLLGNIPERLLIKIGQFSAFIHLDKIQQKQSINQSYYLIGYLKNIPILNQKVKQFQIQIINSNRQQFNLLLKQTITLQELKKFTQNQLLHYQFTL